MGLPFMAPLSACTLESAIARSRSITGGVGRSDVSPGPYPIALMAADAAAVLDAAGVESAQARGASPIALAGCGAGGPFSRAVRNRRLGARRMMIAVA